MSNVSDASLKVRYTVTLNLVVMMVRAVLFVGDCRSVMTRVGFCLMYVVFLITVRPSDQRNLNTLLGFCLLTQYHLPPAW